MRDSKTKNKSKSPADGGYFVCAVDANDRAHVIAGPMFKAQAESMVRNYDAEPSGPATFAVDALGLTVLNAAKGDISSIFGPRRR